MAATEQQSGAAPSKTTQTEGTPSRYAELLNALVDMQASPYYAIRRPTLEGAENAIVTLQATLAAETAARERAEQIARELRSEVSFAESKREAAEQRADALAKDAATNKGFADLWYFVMDEAPLEFESIVANFSSKHWLDEAAKLRKAAKEQKR